MKPYIENEFTYIYEGVAIKAYGAVVTADRIVAYPAEVAY